MTQLPQYSEVVRVPTPGVPKRLAAEETSDAFGHRCEAAARELLEPANRPAEDAPLFVTIISAEGGPLTVAQPDGARSVTVFSSPFRAADYHRALLDEPDDRKFLVSTPADLVTMLADLRGVGVESIALDRCPRCTSFAVYDTESMAAADLLSLWATVKAAELTRSALYSEVARKLAASGRSRHARRLALQTASHVTMEDPGLHLFIGQLAVARKDRTELEEAKRFLKYLGQQDWLRQLEAFERSPPPLASTD